MDLRYALGTALAAGALVTMPVAWADASSDRSRADQEFTKLDTNNDGNIDQTEAQARPWLQQNFSRYDHDRDGKLGKDEFAEAMGAQRMARGEERWGAAGAGNRGERAFERLDKNNDGNIDQAEAQAWPWLQQNFSQYDHDRDGKLGKDEFAEAISAQRAAGGGARGAASAGYRGEREFEGLDKNHDGNIDQTEAQAWPWLQQNFSQYDHDRDGKLGKDEFAEAITAQRAAGGARGAAGAGYRGEREFDGLDKNHDGNIDRTEAQAWPWLQQNFSQYDHDRDGKLGKDEFAEAISAQRAAGGK